MQLPTPQGRDGEKSRTLSGAEAAGRRLDAGRRNLDDALSVALLLPTTTGADAHSSGGSTPKDVTLTDAVVRTDLGRQDNVRHLPTPAARDHKGPSARRPVRTNGRVRTEADLTLADAVLLPTPRASDGSNGGPNQRGSSGDLMLPSAVQPDRWGPYSAAVRRQEQAFGRPAPDPTQPGPQGGQQLAPKFTEWMLGWVPGWVTDVPGLTRPEQLRICGNGVVTQQAAAALDDLLAIAACKVWE